MKKTILLLSVFLFAFLISSYAAEYHSPANDGDDRIEAAPPPNDACAGAISLTVNADLNCGVTLAATTIDATASAPAISGCSGTADDDVWFTFVAAGPSHRIKITGGVQNLVLQVFSGVCGTLTSLACNDPFSGNLEQQVNGLTAGQTYTLRVYTRNNAVFTTFSICVGTPPAAPLNDECAGATLLTVNADLNCAAVLFSSTSGGTPSGGLPNCSTANPDDDVWFKFVATGPSHRIKINALANDMAMQVFSGACGTLTALACDNPFGPNIEEQLNNLTAGQTYYVRVMTRSSLVYDDFVICVGTPPPPPPNDECAGATALTVNAGLNCGAVFHSSTSGGTPSGGAPNCSTSNPDDDVWFKFVATGPSHRVKVTGSAQDMAMQIFSGPCGTLTALSCDNPFGPNIEQQVNGLTAGQTYFVRVMTRTYLTYSDFTICVGTPPAAPANDECAGATALTVNAALNCGAVLHTSTSGGTPSGGAPNCSTSNPDDDVWFKFVATGPSHRVKITGSVQDMAMQIFSGPCGTLAALSCDNPFGPNIEQQVNGLTAGQTYFVRVMTRTYLSYSDFTICVGTPPAAPANDECAGAITLAVNSNLNCGMILNTSTSGGTPSAGIPNCSTANADDDVWFKFVAAAATQWIYVNGTNQDMTVQSFSGTCGALTAIACSNPFSSSILQQLSGLTAGQTYYIRVMTRTYLTYGDFTICVGTPSAAPANDNCAGAVLVTVSLDQTCGNAASATTSGATASAPSISGCSGTADDDVWFKFVATGTAHLITVSNATREMAVQAFSGVCGTLVSLGCNDTYPFSGSVELPVNGLTIGQTYFVRVYTHANQVYSDFTICIAPPPPAPANDNCANATPLTVNADLACGTTLTASTVGATPSNPVIGGCSSSADDDVWYKFVATAPSHRVKVTGSLHRMVLQVFSGVCGTLVSLACNDPFDPNIEQQVNGLTPGATYYLRVYTRDNLVQGVFSICIGTPPPAPANDNCANAVALTVNADLGCGTVLNTSTSGGTPSNPAIGGCTSSADDDVWYKFVAVGPSHRVKITGAVYRMVLQVFSGTCGTLATVVCNDPFTENIEQQLNGLTPGATYYVRVYTRDNLLYSNFTICIGTPPPPPANDACANAVSLVVNADLNCAAVLNTTTSGGLPSNPAVSGCSSSADDDVWYTFVATAPTHRVKITGAVQRMVLQAFSGACGSLVSIACNDPFSENVEQQLTGLTPGSTYYVRVYTRENLVYSDFTICVTTVVPPPANDECANATTLTVNPDLSCTTALNASTNGALPSNPTVAGCFGTADDDVWFKFVATGPSHRVTVSGVTQSMAIQSFSGACGSFTPLLCSANYPTIGTIAHQLNGLTAGQTYYVRVYTYLNLLSSDFTICIGTPPPPPANDECANAIALTVNPNRNCISTLNATTAGALQSMTACTGAGADDDVWFKFVALQDSQTVTVTGGTEWLVLQNFSGDCNSLSSLSCDFTLNGNVQRQLNGLTPGQTYYVRVYTSNNLVSTNFTICVSTPTIDSARAVVHVFLQGPYVSAVQLMHDSLRVKGLVPLSEPYTGLTNFTHVHGGGETTTPAVLAVTGPDAIVDWVFLELRSAGNPAQVLATRSALLQRDGDVVEVDGTLPVRFYVDAGQSYYLAVRHRNHLGVQLGAAKLYPSGVDVATDFRTLPPEGFYSFNGTNPAQRLIGSQYTMWAGNGRIDFQLKYNGSNNDRNAVLSVVGLSTPNAIVPGYKVEDYNMDGQVKYNGSVNDRNVLLGNVGISTPSAILNDQTAR